MCTDTVVCSHMRFVLYRLPYINVQGLMFINTCSHLRNIVLGLRLDFKQVCGATHKEAGDIENP